MGLDVFILEPRHDARGSRRHVCRVEYDGGYVYLRAFLPESSSSGRRIQDAIHAGDAYFEGANLGQLRGCLERARTSLNGKPPRWEEHTGTVYTKRDPKPTRTDTVDREHLRQRIDTFLVAIDEAERIGGRLLLSAAQVRSGPGRRHAAARRGGLDED